MSLVTTKELVDDCQLFLTESQNDYAPNAAEKKQRPSEVEISMFNLPKSDSIQPEIIKKDSSVIQPEERVLKSQEGEKVSFATPWQVRNNKQSS